MLIFVFHSQHTLMFTLTSTLACTLISYPSPHTHTLSQNIPESYLMSYVTRYLHSYSYLYCTFKHTHIQYSDLYSHSNIQSCVLIRFPTRLHIIMFTLILFMPLLSFLLTPVCSCSYSYSVKLIPEAYSLS